MNQTSPKLIFFVSISISALAFCCVLSLCLSMFFKTWSDPATLTAVINTTGILVGGLLGLLVNTRSSPPSSETTTTTTTKAKAEPEPSLLPRKNGEPQKVEVVQPADQPIPVTETPTPPNNENTPPPIPRDF